MLIADAQGQVLDVVDVSEAGDDVQRLSGWLCPGLVNAHGHLELSHLRGRIAEQTGLPQFIGEVLRQRGDDREAQLEAAREAEIEMWNNGIVAVGDIGNQDSLLPLFREKRLQYHHFLEVSGISESGADRRYRSIVSLRESFQSIGAACSVVPHAPYSVTDTLMRHIAGDDPEAPVSLHFRETAEEAVFLSSRSGALAERFDELAIGYADFKPLQDPYLAHWLSLFRHRRSLLLVHNIYLHEAELRAALQQFPDGRERLHLCLCPKANLYIGGVLPDVERLRQSGCSLVLGTDSLASNDSLDLMEEMKTLIQYFPDISLEEMLCWATGNGARALGLEDRVGSFRPGTRPGILLVDPLRMRQRRIA